MTRQETIAKIREFMSYYQGATERFNEARTKWHNTSSAIQNYGREVMHEEGVKSLCSTMLTRIEELEEDPEHVLRATAEQLIFELVKRRPFRSYSTGALDNLAGSAKADTMCFVVKFCKETLGEWDPRG